MNVEQIKKERKTERRPMIGRQYTTTEGKNVDLIMNMYTRTMMKKRIQFTQV